MLWISTIPMNVQIVSNEPLGNCIFTARYLRRLVILRGSEIQDTAYEIVTCNWESKKPSPRHGRLENVNKGCMVRPLYLAAEWTHDPTQIEVIFLSLSERNPFRYQDLKFKAGAQFPKRHSFSFGH